MVFYIVDGRPMFVGCYVRGPFGDAIEWTGGSDPRENAYRWEARTVCPD